MTKKQKQNLINQINTIAKDADIGILFLGSDPLEFAEAIIGINFAYNPTQGNHVVYDYEKVIRIFMRNNKWSREEAEEWYDYNVLRGLPYHKNPPIFVEVVKP